jgi:hypothetical protein
VNHLTTRSKRKSFKKAFEFGFINFIPSFSPKLSKLKNLGGVIELK